MSEVNLKEKYLPSEPCICEICKGFCMRPGWWTVDEAETVLLAGYANRIMLELSPEKDFAVLSPAFKGNEGSIALNIFSKSGCTFFKEGLCELFGSGLQPLECRFCHHSRIGEGIDCHLDIEEEWKSSHGKRVVVRWGNMTGLWIKMGLIVKEK
jgi:hypothetical protein